MRLKEEKRELDGRLAISLCDAHRLGLTWKVVEVTLHFGNKLPDVLTSLRILERKSYVECCGWLCPNNQCIYHEHTDPWPKHPEYGNAVV